MTFLEFVARRLLGEPSKQSGGRAWFCCPYHGDTNPSFCTLPPKPHFKDRFKCFACGSWGDEFDLLKLFHPDESYTTRLDRLADMRVEYERDLSHRGVTPREWVEAGMIDESEFTLHVLRALNAAVTDDDELEAQRRLGIFWALTDEAQDELLIEAAKQSVLANRKAADCHA